MIHDTTTLTIHWVFSCLAILIMVVRLVWRKITKQPYIWGDYFTMGAILCALTRLALIHVVLTWGTSNVPKHIRLHHTFTATEIYQREIGSKLSIANRFVYNSYLWLQKLVLLDLYRRVILDLPYENIIIGGYVVVFFLSYTAVQVTTFTECRPFRLYWQVVPDPGECAKAPIQLLTLGILNIITDFMLLVLPLPVVISLKTPWRRKTQLYVLFSLGIFIMAITIVRLPINSKDISSQISRTTWASTELLTAALVVNAPSLYGCWNKRRRIRSESERLKGHYENRRTGSGQMHLNTIGSGGESREMQRRRIAMARGILVTKDVTTTDAWEEDEREIDGAPSHQGDVEAASQHSSEQEILQR